MNTKAMLCAVVLSVGVLGGCSMNDEDAKKDTVTKDVEKAANDTKNAAEDTIDDVINFFKDRDVTMDNLQTLQDMEFAAYEGRSFSVNGKNAYLYRVKNDDEDMQKVLQEAKEKGKVRVSITGKEMEYQAAVNGNFLLLYDPDADMKSVADSFSAYEMKNVNTSTAENNFDDKSGNVDATPDGQHDDDK